MTKPVAATTSGIDGVQALEEHLLAFDALGLAEALKRVRSVEVERAAARSWVLRDRRFFAVAGEREPGYRDKERYGSTPWMRMMCLIALCSPVEAARAIRWGDVWDHMSPVARGQAALLLAEQSREWAELFLTTTAEVPLSTSDAHAGRALVWLVEQGLAAHDLPSPRGRTFVEYHAIRPLGSTGLEQGVRDRLIPEVLYLKVEFGFAAQLAPLEEAVPGLVEDGTLDRSVLIERCLVSLTTNSRPGSQRVVVKILRRLDLQASDVRGGAGYLTGVIATRDGAVGAYLLPLALELVADPEGLAELARVIGGRKEQKQKQVLLAGLRTPQIRDRVGVDGVLAALGILAAGQEDASLLRALEKVEGELGRVRSPEPAARPAGLWRLTLAPGPDRQWESWLWSTEYRWTTYLMRTAEADPRTFELTLDQFLRHLASQGADEFAGRCRGLRLDGRLGIKRVVRLVEPAFLAGGLSLLWPAVLELAADLASTGDAPAGMPDLLRLLTRYAGEVPDGWPLPVPLADLARSTTATRSQMEACALGAALARIDPNSFISNPPSLDDRGDRPAIRGLWHDRYRVPVLARALRGEARAGLRSRELPDIVAIGNGALDRFIPSAQTTHHLLRMDERLITSLSLAAQIHDLDWVRQQVAHTPRTPGANTGPMTDAIDAWVGGELTADTYWDVLQARMPACPGLDRIVFAWACEQLVRLPSHPGLLSTPSRSDGTLAPSATAAVVRELHSIAQVGPIDLLLTLTRTTINASAQDPIDDLVGVGLCTDPAVTYSAGAPSSFDVVPYLRARAANPADPIDMGRFWPLTAQDLAGLASHDDVRRRVWPQDPRFADDRPTRLRGRDTVGLEHGRLPATRWAELLHALPAGTSATNQPILRDLWMLAQHDGLLEPAVTIPPALDRLRDGGLPLPGLVDSLQFVFERGALRALWPFGLAIATAATTMNPKPFDLAKLLGCLARYAPEVPPPHRVVPAELAAFATGGGRTKSHAAARDLVHALRSTQGPAA